VPFLQNRFPLLVLVILAVLAVLLVLAVLALNSQPVGNY
jgi:hypothetical protein